jgi:hypothetical protein
MISCFIAKCFRRRSYEIKGQLKVKNADMRIWLKPVILLAPVHWLKPVVIEKSKYAK